MMKFMASPEKKLQLGGYSKKHFSEIRQRAENIWKYIDIENEITRHMRRNLKRNNKLCKKNKKKPHEFVVIQLPEHKNWKEWTDYACTHCGKRDYKYVSKLF